MAINGIGRPKGDDYSEEKARRICARMSAGETLTKICSDVDMPHRDTVYAWMDGRPSFSDDYARARERMADAHFDGLIAEGDDLPSDATPAQVQAARLRVDTRKWTASRLKPNAYGDRINVDTKVTVTGHEAALDQLAGPIIDITPDVTHSVTHDDDVDGDVNDINELTDNGT